jgi:AbrB family looped-hinge helix DNA binding protein
MPVATLTSKGQVTIPKEVRDLLALQPGDRICFEVRADGGVEVRAQTRDLMSLFGTIKPEKKGVTIEQMKRDTAEAASKR